MMGVRQSSVGQGMVVVVMTASSLPMARPSRSWTQTLARFCSRSRFRGLDWEANLAKLSASSLSSRGMEVMENC